MRRCDDVFLSPLQWRSVATRPLCDVDDWPEDQQGLEFGLSGTTSLLHRSPTVKIG